MKKAKWTVSVCDVKKMGNGTAACTRQFGSNAMALILVHTVCREFIFPLPEARSGKKKKGLQYANIHSAHNHSRSPRTLSEPER